MKKISLTIFAFAFTLSNSFAPLKVMNMKSKPKNLINPETTYHQRPAVVLINSIDQT